MTPDRTGLSHSPPVRRYHYVVVGAGSAGCVLANRLSANPANRVLLVEAGGRANSLLVRMPAAFSYAMNIDRLNWGYVSASEPGLDGRSLACPRGKGLGGSSSINGMVYVRGHGRDFDEWEALGATGWGFRDCLPYFQRAERWSGGADAFRGGDGPVATSVGNGALSRGARGGTPRKQNMARNPLYAAFVEAGAQAGYARTDDANGFRQEGFGAMQMTVRSGARSSTAREYLKPVTRRANLDVMLRTTVDKVVIDGKTATGVALRRGGERLTVLAAKEVVLAAGAVGSPCILQRSGVGPRDVLDNAGIALRHELPGVGANLQDHLEAIVQYACLQPITLNGALTPLRKAAIGVAWLLGLRRNGLGSTNHFEAGAFLRSDPTRPWPDLQMHFLPAAVRYDGRAAFRGHGYQVHVGANKPKSRGRVAIVSADPDAAPEILFNYLAHRDDVRVWRRCIRIAREVMNQPAFDAYRGAEIQPGTAVATDADIDSWLRRHVESAYHPSSTCSMGHDGDPRAVLDAQCRVRGLERLRVVDASIFPSIPNGNLNAPTMMVAERAADLILGIPTLRASPEVRYAV